MSKFNFYRPQRQSVVGIILVFATTLYKIVKNFWAVGLYFYIAKADAQTLFIGSMALLGLVVFILAYSIFYYLKFQFFISKKNEEFVLQKGVFSSDVLNIPFHKIQHVNFKRNILQRVIGVYSLVIDTAGSGEDEVEIQALSKERADELAALLTAFSDKEKEPVEASAEDFVTPEPETQWKYELGFWNLIKLGLTSHLFRGLALLVAFYSTIQAQIDWEDEYLEQIPDQQFSNLTWSILLIFVLLFISVIINVVETFIKYYNLNIQQKKDSLQVEMGLRNNTRFSLKASRVQLIEEIITPVHKKLNLYKVKIFLASSQDSLTKSKIEAPGLPKSIVEKLKSYFYEASSIEEQFQLQPNKVLLFRMIFMRLLPILLMAVLANLIFDYVGMLQIGIFVAIFVAAVVAYQVFAFQRINLGVAHHFLVKHSGLWSRKKQFIEMYKLQSVSISQPVWYRKRNLVNINFHSAAGDVSFPLVEKEKAMALMNFLLYKVESTDKPWM